MAKVIHNGDIITLSNNKAYAVFKIIDIGERTFVKTKSIDMSSADDFAKITNNQKIDRQFEYFEEIFDGHNVTLTAITDKAIIQKLEA